MKIKKNIRNNIYKNSENNNNKIKINEKKIDYNTIFLSYEENKKKIYKQNYYRHFFYI